jgi:alpha/beta hydrolase fold
MQQQVPQLRFATTRLASGPQVHYAEQGDSGGEPIVFLPGYTDSWFSYSRVLPLLPARYHAYAVDQRGHGDSERPDCCYTVEDFAADVVAFLDAVGVERATLVGHSASCLVARRVAEAHPSGSPGWCCSAPRDRWVTTRRRWRCRRRCGPCRTRCRCSSPGSSRGRCPRCPAGGVLPAAGCRQPQAAGSCLEAHAGGPVRVRQRGGAGPDRRADAAGLGGVGPVATAGGGGPAGGGDPRGQGGGVSGDGPQPQLGAPGAGCRRPGRLHARGLAGSPDHDLRLAEQTAAASSGLLPTATRPEGLSGVKPPQGRITTLSCLLR